MANINIDIDNCCALAEKMTKCSDLIELIEIQDQFCEAIKFYDDKKNKPSAFLKNNDDYQALCSYVQDFQMLSFQVRVNKDIEALYETLQSSQTDIWTTLENVINDDHPEFSNVEDFLQNKFRDPKELGVWLFSGYFANSYLSFLQNIRVAN